MHHAGVMPAGPMPVAIPSIIKGLSDRMFRTPIGRELDLVPTAGSDFHGELIVPGRKLGSAQMDPRDLVRLKERAARTGVKSHDVRN